MPWVVRKIVGLGSCLVVGTAATFASAEPEIEKLAMNLEDDAMIGDVLVLDYVAARKKLWKAIVLCETACGASLRASLHRDYGYAAFSADPKDKAVAWAFRTALALDPTVKPPYLGKGNLAAIWSQAKIDAPKWPVPQPQPPQPPAPVPEAPFVPVSSPGWAPDVSASSCAKSGDHEGACALGRVASCDLECKAGKFVACRGASPKVQAAFARTAAQASLPALLARCATQRKALGKAKAGLGRVVLAQACEGTLEILEDAIAEATALEPTTYARRMDEAEKACACP